MNETNGDNGVDIMHEHAKKNAERIRENKKKKSRNNEE